MTIVLVVVYRYSSISILLVLVAPNCDPETTVSFCRQKFPIYRVSSERCTNMPSREVTLGELAAAMKEIAGDAAGSLGKISYNVDEELSAIVDGFPKKIDSTRG